MLHDLAVATLHIRRVVLILLGLFLIPALHAQDASAPTALQDPASLDQIWQKASSKYDAQRAAILKDVDATNAQGPSTEGASNHRPESRTYVFCVLMSLKMLPSELET